MINSVLEGDVTVATGAVVQHCHLQVRNVLHQTGSRVLSPVVTFDLLSSRVLFSSRRVVSCRVSSR